jgi:ribonuclease HI
LGGRTSNIQGGIMNQQNRPESEGVIGRRMVFCERLQTYNTADLIVVCIYCRLFHVLCCPDSESDPICHHFRLVFTDGSCLFNGKEGATAGIGVAFGLNGEGDDQWSIAVDNTIDSYPKRTSQRTELLAALEGLERICKTDNKSHTRKKHSAGKERACWVIATDSEYVVKGMTEWLPAWKVSIPLSCGDDQ